MCKTSVNAVKRVLLSYDTDNLSYDTDNLSDKKLHLDDCLVFMSAVIHCFDNFSAIVSFWSFFRYFDTKHKKTDANNGSFKEKGGIDVVKWWL